MFTAVGYARCSQTYNVEPLWWCHSIKTRSSAITERPHDELC